MPQLVVNMDDRVLMNIGCKLKVWSYKIPHYSYLNSLADLNRFFKK